MARPKQAESSRLVALMRCIALLIVLISSAAFAQPQITVSTPDADVFIHEGDGDAATVSVTDRSGTTIRGLKHTDFQVTLDSNKKARVYSVEPSRLVDAKA